MPFNTEEILIKVIKRGIKERRGAGIANKSLCLGW